MASSIPTHLFVYGTLRDDSKHDMYRVLARSAVFAGDGVVNARLFDLGEYPGIILSSSSAEHVIGELYKLEPESSSEVLRILDDYEGLGPNDPHPHEYERAVVQVRLPDGRTIPAWAYVLTQLDPSYPRIPSPDYLKWRNRNASAPVASRKRHRAAFTPP